jgi:nicotinamidase/pyrazinamidase
MLRQVFLDIDTQHDFILPGGALYIAGAELIVPNLVRLFDHARAMTIPVLSSADWHEVDDPEFTAWPPHCVRGTPGQAKLAETLRPRRTVMLPSDTFVHPEVLFEDYDQVIFNKTTIDVWTNTNAARLVEHLDAGDYIVFGVATDYCIRTAALGLLQWRRRVAIVSDAIRAVNEASGRAALDEMISAGARVMTTEQVVGAGR